MNLRPTDYESAALTAVLRAPIINNLLLHASCRKLCNPRHFARLKTMIPQARHGTIGFAVDLHSSLTLARRRLAHRRFTLRPRNSHMSFRSIGSGVGQLASEISTVLRCSLTLNTPPRARLSGPGPFAAPHPTRAMLWFMIAPEWPRTGQSCVFGFLADSI